MLTALEVFLVVLALAVAVSMGLCVVFRGQSEEGRRS